MTIRCRARLNNDLDLQKGVSNEAAQLLPDHGNDGNGVKAANRYHSLQLL
jgi:hypothetical protein